MTDVTLRDVADADLEVFFLHQRDDDARHMAAFTAKDPTDRNAFRAHWDRIRANRSVITRTVEVDGEVAGHVASFGEPADRFVMYWIGQEYWGRGVATRALELLLEIDTTRPIHAWVVRDNDGSLRVLEKCGFVVQRRERNFANARGEEVEELLLQLVS